MRVDPIILIVDDHATFRCALGDWLRLAFKSCQIEAAENGEDALAMMMIDPPDVVITDYGLPDINGIEFVRKIKKRNPETMIVVLSTLQGKAYHEAAVQAGAMEFLNKLEVSSKLLPMLKSFLPTPMEAK